MNVLELLIGAVKDKLGILSDEEKEKMSKEVKKELKEDVPEGEKTYELDPDKSLKENFVDIWAQDTAGDMGIPLDKNTILGGLLVGLIVIGLFKN